MVPEREYISKIENLLKNSRNGLTTSEISQLLKIHRNSAAKYLGILGTSGRVEMKQVGTAKVYTCSHRIPTSLLLNYSSDFVMLLDSSLHVVNVNNPLLKFFNITRESIEGKPLDEAPAGMLRALTDLEILKTARIAEKKACSEISYPPSGEQHHFRIKCLPTLFDDGKTGVTVLIEDVTLQKRYRA